jgi:protoporphyrinogen/coproporphyrinogen III oxidase
VSRRVVVVGAGITGLTVAFRLRSRPDPFDVVVLEASGSAGGVVRSARVGDLEIEAGPDSFLARKPWAVELCGELGLGGDLVEQGASAAQILTPGGLRAIPAGRLGVAASARDLLRWDGMSVASRLRAIAEPLVPARRDEGDESIGSLARRRLGRGATEAIVAPLLGGLSAGDVDRLSVRATSPELARWEREDGSMRRGVRRAMSAPAEPDRGTPFVTVRGGLHRLVDALVERIGPDRVRTGVAVRGVGRNGDGFAVSTDTAPERADVVVVTTPAPSAAALLRDVAPDAAEILWGIRTASTAVALFVYPEGTGRLLPDASGFVAQRRLGLPITAATAISRKWPDPAFGSRAVVRAFAGGDGLEDEVDRPDHEVLGRAAAPLSRVYGLPGPEHASLVRWPDAMPQYDVGHLDRVRDLRASLPEGLHVAGSAIGGVGIPDRIREATDLVERITVSGYPDGT